MTKKTHRTSKVETAATTGASLIDELRAALRAAGLRSTAPRLAVFELVRLAGRPVSHGEVADALEPRGFDRASTYRNLVDLAEQGLLVRHDFGDHVWRFEHRGGGAGARSAAHQTEHAHFVCRDCGDVECLPDVEVKLPRKVSKRAVAVEVKGTCERCADGPGR